ncbi:MAG TPA: glycosyltransferase [Candidatus Saccharimonadales bacterium]|nr:glycosyltransferase [Candidatus Saccharimonadales bacterium]
MNISVVIPNYNGRDILLQNLPKVIDATRDYKEGKVELIITDDASTDGSIESIQHFLNDCKNNLSCQILENSSGKNKGFSGNVNKGVKAAKGDIIILLNSDVAPKMNFLKPLLKHFSEDKVFAVGCMDESHEDGKVILRGRGEGRWERGFLVHNAGSLGRQDTLWVSGGSGAFRKSIWDRLGGLNELYNPFYWEDIDLSYRAQKMGYRVLFEKESVVVHEHSRGAIKKQYSPLSVRMVVYRNQFFFTWLNATDTMLIVAHIIWLPYFFLRGFLNHDRAFFFGFFLAFRQIPQILQYRGKVRKLFVKTDQEVTALYQK